MILRLADAACPAGIGGRVASSCGLSRLAARVTLTPSIGFSVRFLTSTLTFAISPRVGADGWIAMPVIAVFGSPAFPIGMLRSAIPGYFPARSRIAGRSRQAASWLSV